MRFHLAVAFLISFPAAAMANATLPTAAMSVPSAIQTARAPNLTLQQIAHASKPSAGHRVLYTSKRALR